MAILGPDGVAGAAAASFTDTSLTVTIPLAVIGGDDGNVNLAAIVGSFAEPTDIVPNDGHITLGSTGRPANARVTRRGEPAARPSPGWSRP